MKESRSFRPGLRAVLTILLLAGVLAGCDTLVEPGSITLPDPIVAEFRFEFAGSTLEEGEAARIQATALEDLRDELRDAGFSPAEVVSARVSEVVLERVQPVSVPGLRFLSRASLDLTQGGTATTVAAAESFSSGARSTLPLVPGRDVTGIFRGSGFSAVLDVTPADLLDAPYILEARVAFTVEVEGI